MRRIYLHKCLLLSYCMAVPTLTTATVAAPLSSSSSSPAGSGQGTFGAREPTCGAVQLRARGTAPFPDARYGDVVDRPVFEDVLR